MECTICMEIMEDSAYSLICGHLFHKPCIEAVIQGAARNNLRRNQDRSINCPICRKASPSDFTPLGLRRIYIGHQAAPPPSEPTLDDKEYQLLLDQLEKLRTTNSVIEEEIVALDRQLVDRDAEVVELRDQLDRANEELADRAAAPVDYLAMKKQRNDLQLAVAQRDDIIRRLQIRLGPSGYRYS